MITLELIRQLLIPSLAIAIITYGPLTLLTWERGPYRILELIRDLTPEGSELDLLINCGICLTPSVLAVMIGGWWILDGYKELSELAVLALYFMSWGWLWIFIRMTRFGRA